MEIDVLGTKYDITFKERNEDEFLADSDGYTDKTTKKIVIVKMPQDNQLGC